MIKNFCNSLVIRNLSLSKELSYSKLHQVKLFLTLLYFSFTRKTFFRGKPFKFVFYHNNNFFELILCFNLDLAILNEIFVLKEYEWEVNSRAKTILDLGAHWGDTSIYYSLYSNTEKIVAVEPMPDLYKRLKQNTDLISKIECIEAAISDHDGETVFYVSEDTVGNSLSKRSDSQVPIAVPSLRFDSLIEKVGITRFDLVKFDIEGGENFLFGNELFPTIANAYIGEIHLNLISYSLKDIEAIFGKEFEVEFTLLKKNRYIMKAIRQSV